MSSLRARVQHALERGSWHGPMARVAAGVWARVADPVRELCLPRGVRVIAVGGATLGGSGKTPLVLELAKSFAPGAVAVVSSGYPAKLRQPRRVHVGDTAAKVGDEALMLARAGLTVITGGDRTRAVALASELAPVVIVDALLQSRPERVATSILVLDASAPWGSGVCPPCGDLRAAPGALLAATDVVVLVEREASAPAASFDARGVPVLVARSELGGAACPDGAQIPIRDLAGLRLGVVLAVARPGRILEDLAFHGVVPARVELHADHAVPTPAAPAAGIAAWLTTTKCATKLGSTFAGAPVWTLSHRVRLPPELGRLLAPEAVAPRQKPVLESAPCFPTQS